ncbi:PPE family protein PPE26 [Mycobacterium talmoniae]|uniref:PPE family protein PPE26 n=1 Tax=Mycobacterium talmoniae TaxID=1858794 RepID=A0A2S8BP79_9MYCO|nr:PPE family protein PPE26 [Mycobacterium talmoniae]
MGNNFVQIAKTLGLIGGSAPAGAAGAAGAAGGLGGLGAMGGGPVSAGLGAANGVGRLAVPPSWLGSTPLSSSGFPAPPVPVSSVSLAPEAGAGAGNLLGGMPLAGAGASGAAGSGPKYGFRPTVMARPPFAG